MNVVVTSEAHFIDVDGTIFSRSIGASFFERYREVWEEVLLLARLSRAAAPPEGASPINMRDVRFIGLPDFKGPLQFFANRR
jgi:hypothetical protein